MKIFFVAGFLFTVSSYALIVAGILGLCLSPLPIWLSRALVVLSISLLAASTVLAYAHLMELFIGYYGANAYELPRLRARATSFYGVAYWFLVGSTFIPQLFWFPSFRSSPVPALLIALAVAIPPLIERVLVSRAS